MTEPDEHDLDLPSTEEVLSDHHRSKASFPMRVVITLMVIGMIGLGAAGHLLFETQRSLLTSSAEIADRLAAIASLEAKQSELVALVESHPQAGSGDAIVNSLATGRCYRTVSTSALIAELNVCRTAVLLNLRRSTLAAGCDEAIQAAERYQPADLARLLMIEPCGFRCRYPGPISA